MSGRVLWGSSSHCSCQQPAGYWRATRYLFPKLLYPSWTGICIQWESIKLYVLQHGAHKQSTRGYQYFPHLRLVEKKINICQTKILNKWNTLQLAPTKLIKRERVTVPSQIVLIIFLTGSFVTKIQKAPGKKKRKICSLPLKSLCSYNKKQLLPV